MRDTRVARQGRGAAARRLGLPHKKGKTWDLIVRKDVKLPFH